MFMFTQALMSTALALPPTLPPPFQAPVACDTVLFDGACVDDAFVDAIASQRKATALGWETCVDVDGDQIPGCLTVYTLSGGVASATIIEDSPCNLLSPPTPPGLSGKPGSVGGPAKACVGGYSAVLRIDKKLHTLPGYSYFVASETNVLLPSNGPIGAVGPWEVMASRVDAEWHESGGCAPWGQASIGVVDGNVEWAELVEGSLCHSTSSCEQQIAISNQMLDLAITGSDLITCSVGNPGAKIGSEVLSDVMETLGFSVSFGIPLGPVKIKGRKTGVLQCNIAGRLDGYMRPYVNEGLLAACGAGEGFGDWIGTEGTVPEVLDNQNLVSASDCPAIGGELLQWSDEVDGDCEMAVTYECEDVDGECQCSDFRFGDTTCVLVTAPGL